MLNFRELIRRSVKPNQKKKGRIWLWKFKEINQDYGDYFNYFNCHIQYVSDQECKQI